MMRPENVSRKSTSPSSAHSVAKYASASEMILGTIASSDLGGDQRVGRRSPRGKCRERAGAAQRAGRWACAGMLDRRPPRKTPGRAPRVHRVHDHLDLLLPLLQWRVIHDLPPKHGNGELVHGALVQLLVGRADEGALRLGALSKHKTKRAGGHGGGGCAPNP
eukprot:scaffold8680_cov107-Isochrysis_galbana.AAC.4